MPGPWDVVHIDLDQPLAPLEGAPGREGVFAVFWWRGIALGHREVRRAELPLRPVQVRERALEAIAPAVADRLGVRGFAAPLPVKAHLRPPQPPPDVEALAELREPLARLSEVLPPPTERSSPADAAVIVCTRDRPAALRRCLQALGRLTCRPHEILVVDNAPQVGATRKLAASMPGVRYVAEPRPGLSVARNTGLRSTERAVVAFTDDDVEVHPDWLGRLLGAFGDPAVAAVTGLVLPAELETEAQVLFQQMQARDGWPYRVIDYDKAFFEQMKPYGVPVWHLGAGANMAFRREVFDEVGLFDERLGAGASGCSEDSELWYRLLAAGYTCRYEPAAAVFHYHRRDMAGLRHQMHQYMQGHVAALLVQYVRHGHAGNLYRAFGTLPKYYLRLALRRLRRGRGASTAALADQVRGCAAGALFYLRHRGEPAVTDPPYPLAQVQTESSSALHDHA